MKLMVYCNEQNIKRIIIKRPVQKKLSLSYINNQYHIETNKQKLKDIIKSKYITSSFSYLTNYKKLVELLLHRLHNKYVSLYNTSNTNKYKHIGRYVCMESDIIHKSTIADSLNICICTSQTIPFKYIKKLTLHIYGEHITFTNFPKLQKLEIYICNIQDVTIDFSSFVSNKLTSIVLSNYFNNKAHIVLPRNLQVNDLYIKANEGKLEFIGDGNFIVTNKLYINEIFMLYDRSDKIILHPNALLYIYEATSLKLIDHKNLYLLYIYTNKYIDFDKVIFANTKLKYIIKVTKSYKLIYKLQGTKYELIEKKHNF